MEKKRKGIYCKGELLDQLEERAVVLAQYMIENKATVRQTAAVFGVSKSTVHKDLTEKLPAINHALAVQVRQILDVNKSERHIRGGMATKDKYLREKQASAMREQS